MNTLAEIFDIRLVNVPGKERIAKGETGRVIADLWTIKRDGRKEKYAGTGDLEFLWNICNRDKYKLVNYEYSFGSTLSKDELDAYQKRQR